MAYHVPVCRDHMPIVPGSQVQSCNTTAVECMNAYGPGQQEHCIKLALCTLSTTAKQHMVMAVGLATVMTWLAYQVDDAHEDVQRQSAVHGSYVIVDNPAMNNRHNASQT